MNFQPGKPYKLHEMDGALVITDSDKNVAGGSPLILADAGALLTYLDRYVYEREKGTVQKDAHDLALRTAGVTQIRRPT